jgi:hypothetical protein
LAKCKELATAFCLNVRRNNRGDFMEVEDCFPEERALLNSDTSCYGSCLRKCYRYHYTNIESVVSILESKCIWLMHYSNQNDSSEGRYILENIAKKSKSYKDLIEALTANFYLSSFSLYGNLLSQWRGYGDINIGFDYEGMESDLRKIGDQSGIDVASSGMLFSECTYLSRDNESFEKIVNDIENRMKEIVKPNPLFLDQYQYLSIGATCFSVKHPGFREEHEYRVYSYLWEKKPFLHNGRNHLEFHFSPCRVQRIVIGPSNEQESNRKRIEEFLSSRNEYEHVELVTSTIPFIKKENTRSNYCA